MKFGDLSDMYVGAEVTVPHYGIHWAPTGVAYLHQEKTGVNALGLREKTPFRVVPPKRNYRCNHLIPLSIPLPDELHWQYFLRLLPDPLVQAMLPLPKDGVPGVWYVDDPEDRLSLYLLVLSKLSSPITSPVHPFWTMETPVIVDALQMTNVQPLVLTQVKAENTRTIGQIAKAAVIYPRRLVMTGSPDVVLPMQVQRIKTDLLKYPIEDLITLAWENIGAVIVRKYMRKEKLSESLVRPKVEHQPLPRRT